MATFSFEEGMVTDVFSTCCALRMRVSISAMGSLMLILNLLPAGLGHARDFAAHGHLAQLDAPKTELAENATRAAGDCATVALARGIRVARQLLQLQASLIAVFVGLRRIVDNCLQSGALCGKFICKLRTLDFTIDE